MNIDKKLTYLALRLLLCPVLLLGFMFAGIMDEGMLSEEVTFHYCYQMASIVTLLLLPLALKLMSLKSVKEKIVDDQQYVLYSLYRLMMINAVITFGVLGYIFFMESTMLWTAGIGLIALVFIWPSQKRRLHEQGIEENE